MANETYHTTDYYRQQRLMLLNGDPRALVCFCIDVSQSMSEWWIEEGGLTKHTGSGFADGHNINYFNPKDIKDGYAHYQKIDKLNEVLKCLLEDFQSDKSIRNKVAISIVVYSYFGDVKCDFLDCSALHIPSCECKVEHDETAMGAGLRTALSQLDEMEKDFRAVGKDIYTPLLVFMTDGTPTDDPSHEFALVRERVEKGELFIFPLGIGEGADMARLRDMFPDGKIPTGFNKHYKMIHPDDYNAIFQEIKSHIKKRQETIVSEGNSEQSTPAIDDVTINNNQMGKTPDYLDFLTLR